VCLSEGVIHPDRSASAAASSGAEGGEMNGASLVRFELHGCARHR
jgi:hypothetical protein